MDLPPASIDGDELEVLRAGVRLMALRALGDPAMADEVAQETIVRAFHALRTSRPDKLGAFVAGIARHVITDIIRARPREVSLEDLAEHQEPQVRDDALVALCDAAEQARVAAALSQLAPDDRALLQMLFFQGLSCAEVAQRLGAPADRIRQRKLRAVARLRAAFDALPEGSARRHVDDAGPTVPQGVVNVLAPSRSAE